ncbi:MAG: ArnT family glycosyltransferase [Candidatus Methylomirabilaceae bacterium]
MGVILLCGAALRIWGLDYGLPQFLYPDETKYIRPAQIYLKDRQIANPHYFLNPPLFSHVVLATVAILDLLHVPVGDREHLVMVSRSLSVLFGTGSVALLFLIGRQLDGTRVGLIAASLLAANFLATRSSHSGVNDMMMLALLLVCLHAFFFGVSGQGGALKLHRGLVLAAFTGGLAVSTKYNAAITLVPLGAFMLVRWSGWARAGLVVERWLDILRDGGTVGGWFILGVLAGNPWILQTPKEVWEGFSLQMEVAEECYPGQELTPMSQQVITALAQGSGIAVLLLAVLGVGLLWRKRHPGLRFLALLTVVYVAYFAFLSKALFARFLIPALPGICLLAAIAMEDLSSYVAPRARSALLVGLVGLSLSQPLYNSVLFLRILSRPDTRTLAGHWAVNHIPPTSDRYHLLRKDVLSLHRFGFHESQPARPGPDRKFPAGYYLVTALDIREGCTNLLDIYMMKLIELLFQQGTIVYHDNPSPGSSGLTMNENRYSPYYELGTIRRPGPEIWIVKVDGS